MKESEKSFKKEIDYHRYWKEMYQKEHKLRQEAENEMVLIKGITITNSPELRAAKKEINDLKNKIADLENTLESKDYFEKPDYKFLVEENLDLRRKITELEQEILETKADNMKLANQIDDKIHQLRKLGIM
jgi:cell division protein FtsL|tara:strand:+ start:324 stop:716 length:393 start_codon:yes stop_codon:yes gene_type:complete